jgi:hypothetical protein
LTLSDSAETMTDINVFNPFKATLEKSLIYFEIIFPCNLLKINAYCRKLPLGGKKVPFFIKVLKLVADT